MRRADHGFYRECMATLKRGFANEHAAAAWFAVRQKRIYRMPVYWAARIVFAYRQTGVKEAARGEGA